jgi:hypothetical protein
VGTGCLHPFNTCFVRVNQRQGFPLPTSSTQLSLFSRESSRLPVAAWCKAERTAAVGLTPFWIDQRCGNFEFCLSSAQVRVCLLCRALVSPQKELRMATRQPSDVTRSNIALSDKRVALISAYAPDDVLVCHASPCRYLAAPGILLPIKELLVVASCAPVTRVAAVQPGESREPRKRLWLRGAQPSRRRECATPSVRSTIGAPPLANAPSNRTREIIRRERSRRKSRGRAPPLEYLPLCCTRQGRQRQVCKPPEGRLKKYIFPQPRAPRNRDLSWTRTPTEVQRLMSPRAFALAKQRTTRLVRCRWSVGRRCVRQLHRTRRGLSFVAAPLWHPHSLNGLASRQRGAALLIMIPLS